MQNNQSCIAFAYLFLWSAHFISKNTVLRQVIMFCVYKLQIQAGKAQHSLAAPELHNCSDDARNLNT